MLSALQARIRIVQSSSNPRVKALRSAILHPPVLRHAQQQSSGDAALVALEGFHLLAEALRAQHTFSVIFLRQSAEAATLNTLLQTLAATDASLEPALPADIEILALPPALFESLLDAVSPQPIAALVTVPPVSLLPADAALVLVLCGLQDPGNVGTLLRSAHAFGAAGAILLRGTASPWSAKSLRASAGAALHLPLIGCDSAAQARALLQAQHIRSYGAVPRGGSTIAGINLAAPSALWIGSEGAGLTVEQLAACDDRLTLEMHAGAESLNAAVAGSLLLYEAARSRRPFASKHP